MYERTRGAGGGQRFRLDDACRTKLFKIADRGTYSVSLFQATKDVEAFARRILEGPRKGERDHIKLLITEPDDVLLVQPALSCHRVLTLSSVPCWLQVGKKPISRIENAKVKSCATTHAVSVRGA